MKSRVYSDGSAEYLSSYPSDEQGYGRVAISDVLHFGNKDTAREHEVNLYVKGGAYSSDQHFVSLRTTGEVHEYAFETMEIQDSGHLRATLVYTDIPAYPSQPGIINKLSLKVINNSTGEEHYRLNTGRKKDNVQMVDIPLSQLNSSFIVVVTADAIFKAQPYALVITGTVVFKNRNGGDDDVKLMQNSPFFRLYQIFACVVFLATIVAASFFNMMERSSLEKQRSREEDFARMARR